MEKCEKKQSFFKQVLSHVIPSISCQMVDITSYHMISPFIHHNSPLLGQTTPPGDGNSAASPPRRLAKMGDPGQSDITRTNIP
jgi:hypothetical protein